MPSFNAALSRRRMLRGALATGIGGTVSRFRRGQAAATPLTGKIAVGYEDPVGILQPQIDLAVQAVQAAHPGVEIELRKAPGGNFATQIFLALSAKRAPDVFLLNSLGIGELAAAGFLAPLDDYLAGWDGWAQYPDLIKHALTFKGHVWALPFVLDTHFLYYRKDVFERAGLPRGVATSDA